MVRIEDIDRQRSRQEYADQLLSDLQWLGLDWDGEVVYQSRRYGLYEAALRQLAEKGLVYPCACTRADIMASSAPHQSDGRLIYGGRCRPAGMPRTVEMPQARHCVRLWVPDRDIEFVDRNFGRQTVNLARDCGDFIVKRADGGWAYQLAVTVDDATQGITEVVRGEDLLLSAAQQIYLFEQLGYKPPEYAHIPLLRNRAGQRLAKRDAAANLDFLRGQYAPHQVLAMVLSKAELEEWAVFSGSSIS